MLMKIVTPRRANAACSTLWSMVPLFLWRVLKDWGSSEHPWRNAGLRQQLAKGLPSLPDPPPPYLVNPAGIRLTSL
jgi:hypothetical protein